jgi:hypothetical protein
MHAHDPERFTSIIVDWATTLSASAPAEEASDPVK